MRLQKRIYENEQTESQILETNPDKNSYNSLSNIFLKENKKINNIKI